MSAFITACRECGREFEPAHEAICAGTWRQCPNCKDARSGAGSQTTTRCEECGRELRGNRSVCLRCMGVTVL